MNQMASQGSIIVTGTNGGLGSAIVKHIITDKDLASNYTGVYTVRKTETAEHVKTVLRGAPASHRYEIQEMELGSMASVRRFAAEVNGRVARGEMPPIRSLILNAGFQEYTELTLSEDGFDMAWQVNYLSNMLLALLLLQSMDQEHGRILIIGSFTHDIKDHRSKSLGAYDDPRFPTLFPPIDDLAKGRWSTPAQDSSMKSGFRRYGASKLCALMLMVDLANRLAKDPQLNNITIVGVDPAGMPTNLMRRAPFFLGPIFIVLLIVLAQMMEFFSANAPARSTARSAADVIRACFEVESLKGEFMYFDGRKPSPLAEETRDEEKRRMLWEYGVQAAKLEDGDTVLANWR